MPGERQGSAEARALFEKAINTASVREWERFDSAYNRALSLVATSKKRPDLLELDAFIHNELSSIAQQRSPPHFLHSEIAQVTKWKLTRGKFRPLQKMVEGNAASAVTSATTRSLQAVQDGRWEDAFEALTQLRGVGVATASAVLAIVSPADCPFMADEVLEGTIHSRDYTMRAYTSMRTALLKKAKELPEGWTAERVGRAMWTCAMLSSFSVGVEEDDHEPADLASTTHITSPTAKAATAAAAAASGSRKRRQHVLPPDDPDAHDAHDVAPDDVGDAATVQKGTTKRRRINAH
eukprot:gene13402-9597_t